LDGRVGVPGDGTQRPRKTMLIVGGSHAREWISTSTVTYLAWSFIAAYGKEKLVSDMLHEFDVVLVPAVNPDGYEYTWNTDRLWRKTRQGTNLRFCRGLDLDHAFGFRWDNTKLEPCSESYGGEAAFQAVEAKALSDWAINETIRNNVQFTSFIDLHSYSQNIMYPFSFSCGEDPPNLENMMEVAHLFARGIGKRSGYIYTVASACEGILGCHTRGAQPRIESGGGSAIDWFAHAVGVKYSYQIKLRDTGSYGFLLPSSQIVPTGEEMFNAMREFGDFLLGNNGIETQRKPGTQQMPAPDSPQDDEGWAELRRRRRTL